MDLDPRYLETFLAVSRERSFGRAAVALHKTQPAVSYQIQRLEQQLGTRLLDRTTRRLTLTHEGARLYELCQRFFSEFEGLARGFHDGTGAQPKPLRIASVSGFGRYVLFPLVARELQAVPYSLRFPTADQVFGSLEEGSCDLGFVYLPHVSSRVLTVPVWREELVLVAPPGLRDRRLPRFEAFEQLPFVTYDECEYVFGKWFEALFGRQPGTLQSLFHFEELEEVISTVASGRGWSIVPEDCAAGFAARRKIVVLRHARNRVHNLIYAVTRAKAPEHAAARQIIEALRSASGPLEGQGLARGALPRRPHS